MSYIAEPYSHTADQILTSLTGGTARESNRFFPGANRFSFERDSIITESVHIIGQVNGAFYSFMQGRDFIVTEDGFYNFLQDNKEKFKPASNAVWPDEGSEFFVSYYHSESKNSLLTDRNVGSLARTLGESFARELVVLRKQLEFVYKSGFIDTAEGQSLDMVVALLGISRRSREYAVGRLRFFRDTPAQADIYIPEGIKVSTALNPVIGFTTSTARTLRRGQLSVEVDIRAEIKGAAGMVSERTITIIHQPILGLSGVINDAPTIFGGDEETDEELRNRTKKVMGKSGKATPAAITNALLEAGRLKENDVKIVEELQFRPGVIKIFFAGDLDSERIKSVQEAVLNSRPAGIRVEHNLPLPAPVSAGGLLPSGNARGSGDADKMPEAKDFKLPLTCDITVFMENPRLTGGEKSLIETSIRNSVYSYIDSSAIGGMLVYNKIVADIMNIHGVLDIDLLLNKGRKNFDVPEGLRAVINKENDITVSFAGASVKFDFYITIKPKAGTGLTNIRNEIIKRLSDYFSANPNEVTSGSLISKVAISDLYEKLEETDLMWNAEYEEAGLVIRSEGGRDAATTIPPGDIAVFRNVEIKEKK